MTETADGYVAKPRERPRVTKSVLGPPSKARGSLNGEKFLPGGRQPALNRCKVDCLPVAKEAAPSEIWRQIFCLVGGGFVGASALPRLATPLPTSPAPAR